MWSNGAKNNDKRTVSIIVYGGKGLKSERGKHKFAVSCEIAGQKCRTDVVEDFFGNPVFNKEFQIQTENLSAPLVLTATEKHDRDSLGQMTIPLSELTDARSFTPRIAPLQPTKKNQTVSGELVYDVWISAVVPKPEPIAATAATAATSTAATSPATTPSGLARLRRKFNYSPVPTSDGKPTRRHSSDASLIDLKSFHAVARDAQLGFIPTDNASLRDAVYDQSTSVQSAPSPAAGDADGYRKRSSLQTVREQYFPHPVVDRISPREGPQFGGTVITIDGRDLGLSKEDVVGLLVCGSDVLDSMQYVSPSRLQCTTGPWRACVGGVTIETLSGGRASSSTAQFTFSESLIHNASSAGKILDDSDCADAKLGRNRPRSASVGVITHTMRATANNDSLSIDNTSLPHANEIGLDGQQNSSEKTQTTTPVVEIQPMVGSRSDSSSANDRRVVPDASQPPKKPPRAMYVCGQPVLPRDENGHFIVRDESSKTTKTVVDYESYLRATVNEDDDLDKYDVKECSTVAELKRQLTANIDHITELVEENESLKEQYEMLRMYIETLLIRVVDNCPQVLCVD